MLCYWPVWKITQVCVMVSVARAMRLSTAQPFLLIHFTLLTATTFTSDTLSSPLTHSTLFNRKRNQVKTVSNKCISIFTFHQLTTEREIFTQVFHNSSLQYTCDGMLQITSCSKINWASLWAQCHEIRNMSCVNFVRLIGNDKIYRFLFQSGS